MELTGFDRESAKIRSLMERMSMPHTGRQGMLNEERHLNEAVERKVESPDKVFDILDQIGKNDFVCVGYVSGANLDLPKVKRVNPATNRMKSYDDMETFSKNMGSEEEIAALVKITSYNFRYYNNKDVKKNYGEYKTKFNDIRGKYGLDPVADKENDYTQTMNYGSGVDVYAGGDETKQGNFYVAANTSGAGINGVVYAVNAEGHIIQELKPEQVKPYLKAKGEEVPGANALRKMGVEETEVKKYIEEVKSLKMNYKRFEGNSILWVAATVNGQKIVYINSNMMRSVNDININPQDFIAKAQERYNVDMNKMPEA
jgi:hypothetical protein